MKIKIILFFTLLITAFATFSFITKNKVMSSEIQNLTYLIRTAKDSSKKTPLLVLLHGHGSNENDLFSFNSQIPENWIVVSVRGPYQLAENSYRWYDVKMVNGKIVINIEEEERSREKLIQLISEITQKYNVDSEKIIVAGFSQGANMAQSLGLSKPNLVAGFGVFSGRYVEEFTPYISKSIALKNSKAFITHGSGDTMLPKTYVTENITKLKELGIQITYCEDSNGHSISTKQWDEFSKWLINFN
jgi:phospholipase/carboxylesterase